MSYAFEATWSTLGQWFKSNAHAYGQAFEKRTISGRSSPVLLVVMPGIGWAVRYQQNWMNANAVYGPSTINRTGD